MMYLFFDTETTGLPKNYSAPITDSENWPRIIQLAWMLCGEDGNEISRYCKLIYPDGWVMPTEKFWIDNGYSQEKSLAEGVRIADALCDFRNALNSCECLIAHNMSFDSKIVGAEFVRENMSCETKPIKICTKESSTEYCQLQGKYGFKWPTLTELHTKLFDKPFEGAHDALNDVIALKDCFFELKKLQIIK